MCIELNRAPVPSLFDEPSRVTVLPDGRTMPAGELARSRRALSLSAQRLQHARSCYNHLAGKLAVEIARTLEERGYLGRTGEKRYVIQGRAARRWFAAQGIELEALPPGRHGVAMQCLDWTERRPHLAGPLGTKLFACWCEQGLLKRSTQQPRLVEVTPFGRLKLQEDLGLESGPPATV